MNKLSGPEIRAVKTLEHFLRERSPSDGIVNLHVEASPGGYLGVVSIRSQEFEFFLDLIDNDVDTLIQRIRQDFTKSLGRWHQLRKTKIS